MRILVLGDFGGRAALGVENAADLASRRPLPVDVDNFDRQLARFAPRVRLASGASGTSDAVIAFERLEDFHPDSLYRRLPLFRGLRELRTRLQDPATFEQAAAGLRGALALPSPAETTSPTDGADKAGPAEDDAAMIARLLGRPLGAGGTPTGPASGGRVDITELVRRVVAPHVVPTAPPLQDRYLAWVDAAAGEQMRKVLHDPAFQSLEALWRSVWWLVSSLDLGSSLQLWLLDATLAELRDHLQPAEDLTDTALYRTLVADAGGTPGTAPWSLLIGDYTFGETPDDLGVLAALGALGAHAGAPFLAAADARLLGCASVVDTPDPHDWCNEDPDAAQRFHALRTSAVAASIGLALPRVLLRLPYGRHTDRTEALDFEELAPERQHAHYLWGNPAFGCALLIGQAFLARGWQMEPGDVQDLEDLPAHVFEQDGERHLQPCAEVLLSEGAGEAILARGLVPLLSYRNRNAARVMRFQSIAEPPAPLAGPWG